MGDRGTRDAAVQAKIEKARIELWTARDMVFVLDRKRGIQTIPRFTKCGKPPYTKKIKTYLKNFEEKSMTRPDGVSAVCVKLEGMLRYIWRTDVLTRQEYVKIKEEEKTREARVLGSKLGRSVGEGSDG